MFHIVYLLCKWPYWFLLQKKCPLFLSVSFSACVTFEQCSFNLFFLWVRSDYKNERSTFPNFCVFNRHTFWRVCFTQTHFISVDSQEQQMNSTQKRNYFKNKKKHFSAMQIRAKNMNFRVGGRACPCSHRILGDPFATTPLRPYKLSS